jgi:hypothetical protein
MTSATGRGHLSVFPTMSGATSSRFPEEERGMRTIAMPETMFHPSLGDRARLRRAISEIATELDCLGREASLADHRLAMGRLVSSWAEFVGLMTVGIGPELQ